MGKNIKRQQAVQKRERYEKPGAKRTGKSDGSKKQGGGKKLSIAVAVIFALAVLALGAGGYFIYKEYKAESETNEVKTGTELLEQGDFEGAAASFEKAVKAEEEKRSEASGDDSAGGSLGSADGAAYITEAYRGLGMAYYELQEYEKAGAYLQQALDAGGEKTPVIYNLLGLSYMQLEDYDNALTAFENGVSLSVQETYQDAEGAEQTADYSAVIQEMKFNRIVCLEKKLDWAGAREETEAYLAQYPDDADAQKEAEFLATR